MKKRLLSVLLALSLLVVPAHAAENSMENFIRDTETCAYTGQFPDVPQEHTFYNNVAALYEYGLTKGKTDGTFGLTDNVTVSQVIIFAARVRSLYCTGDPEMGPSSYLTEAAQAACMPYLAYLKAEQVLGDELDDTLFTPATRAQVAHVLANVLPENVIPAINQDILTEAYAKRKFVIDVDEYTPYQQDILTLYRLGISRGSDEMGSFLPDQPITRGALSAMLTRLVDADLRIQLAWKTFDVPDVSQMTLSKMVKPGTYISSPKSAKDLEESIRYMLYTNTNRLRLFYPDLTQQRAREIMIDALYRVKSYCEQGYNAAEASIDATSITIQFSAGGITDDIASYREASLAAAKDVHDTLWANGHITADMTEYEKARAYYTWICANCVYDEAADENSISHIPYNLFQNGLAVCDGYTGAYNMLLKLEGIDCYAYIHGDHIWTVAILDGEEFHIDTTWGDMGTGASSTYFAMTPKFSMAIHGVNS